MPKSHNNEYQWAKPNSRGAKPGPTPKPNPNPNQNTGTTHHRPKQPPTTIPRQTTTTWKPEAGRNQNHQTHSQWLEPLPNKTVGKQ